MTLQRKGGGNPPNLNVRVHQDPEVGHVFALFLSLHIAGT